MKARIIAYEYDDKITFDTVANCSECTYSEWEQDRRDLWRISSVRLWCTKMLEYVDDESEPDCSFPTVLEVLVAKEEYDNTRTD